VLNRGEVLQLAQTAELTGSVVQSDGPIAAFGAHECLAVPDGVAFCDPAHQELPPVRTLGHALVGAPHPARAPAETTSRWRLTGVVDGTLLAFTPGTPPGAPSSIQAGQTVDFTADGAFVVTSQDAAHPLLLGAFMTGGAPLDGAGDPAWVIVSPRAQYRGTATFAIDPTFPESHLVVVRVPDDQGGRADVELDCVGTLGGWVGVGDVEVTQVPLVTGAFVAPSCTSGAHTLRSAGRFDATVWSWGGALVLPGASLATPAFAGRRILHDVVVVAAPR